MADPTKKPITARSALGDITSELDAILGPQGGAAPMPEEGADLSGAGAGPVTEEEMAEGEEAPGEEEMGGEDPLKPLIDTLGVSESKAQAILDTAPEIQALASLAPQELADTLGSNMSLLLQVEERIAKREDASDREKGSADMMAEMDGKKKAFDEANPDLY